MRCSSRILLFLPLVLGAASIYLLLPRPEPYPTLWGALLGAVALVLGAVFVVRAALPGLAHWHLLIENVLFYLFSLGAVVSGVLLVTQSNPARAALCFTLVVLSTCGLFLLLGAPFLMAATVIIYAGAIIITFLFVIMLAAPRPGAATPTPVRASRPSPWPPASSCSPPWSTS